MPPTYICSCPKCLITHPAGRQVGKTTFFHHARSPKNQQQTASQPKYQCKCPGHPPRLFFSKSSYYRHLKGQRSKNFRTSADSMQLDTENQEACFLHDNERILSDSQSISNDNQVMSNDESSGDDRRMSGDDAYVDEEACSDTFTDDVASLTSDSDDSDGLLQGNVAIRTALPEDSMSEDLEFDSEDNNNELFLRLAQWAQDMPRNRYIELKRLLVETQGVIFPSLRCQSQRLKKLTGVEAQFIDCCSNNCIAFTAEYANIQECPFCQKERFRDTNRKKPWKTFLYIPLIPRLKLQYRDAARAEVLTGYRKSLLDSHDSINEVRDFFDGRLFHEFHVQELELFRDPHDVALHLSIDGVQLTNMDNHEITPVIFMNLNLPPQERYKVNNILAGLLIPGPKKPKVIDTFLRPLVDELLQLDNGVSATDGRSLTTFQLRAWVTMVTGDGPGLAEVIGMKRPGNAVRPCRTCMIKAERGSRIYYVPHSRYNFENPPLRSNLRDMIRLVEEACSEEYRRETGITRSSILLELRSLHFPRSFPADIMHLVLQNVTPALFTLWNRTKLAADKRDHGNFEIRPYHLDDESIESIGSALSDARVDIPTYLGHAPRRIDNHHKGYKAAEWEAWLKLFGVPLLDQCLDEQCVDNFRTLSRIYILSTRHSIAFTDIAVLDALVIQFVRSYEQIYLYSGKNYHDPERLKVCSVNVHYLLHLPAYIRDCGPARYWWQFPMERFCGIIKPRARSKSQLSSSLANAIVLAEHLNHVRFTERNQETANVQCAYPALQGRFKARLASYQRIRLAHITCSDVEFHEIKFYKRCQLRDDLTVGSTESQRRVDITRSNRRMCYTGGNNEMRFGVVHFFIQVLGAGGRVQQLAWISQLEDIDIDREKRIASFGREGGRTWVDVGSICSLIGILKHGNINFIVTDIDIFK